MPEKIKKHPVRRIVLVVFLILLVGVVLVSIWQKNNIKALWLMATADEQSLSERQEQQEQARQELLEKYEIGDISEVELPQQDGELDIQAFLESTGSESAGRPESTGQPESAGSESAGSESAGQPEGDASAPEGAAASAPAEPPQAAASGETASGSETGSNEVIQRCVAALYALESQYMDKLDGIIKETKSEYRALPKAERTQSKKLALVRSKMDVLLAAERQCDSEVEQLLQRIQQELDKQGSKSGLTAEIRQVYADRKATWKASCLTKLSK